MEAPKKTQDLYSIVGRTALVTGASSGLGERFCETLAANGARVVCCARRQDRLDKLVARIRSAGGTAIAHQIDVVDGEAIPAAFDRAEAEFGTVDILINNAGLVKAVAMQETSDEMWDQHIAVHLTATFKFTREAVRRLVPKEMRGSIINVASGGAILCTPGTSPYAAAKGGMLSFTKAAAVEFAPHRIRSNVILPGLAVTEILPETFFQTEVGQAMAAGVPLGYPAPVSDFDGLIVFLASDASSYITGAQIAIDGGVTVSQKGSRSRRN